MYISGYPHLGIRTVYNVYIVCLFVFKFHSYTTYNNFDCAFIFIMKFLGLEHWLSRSRILPLHMFPFRESVM